MNMRFSIGFAFALAFTAGAGVEAGIIVDHQPHPYGGPSSDTSFLNVFGQPYWQRLADDFTLSTPQDVTNVNFWGFYEADNPPASETMRIRFYTARQTDGLPGDLLKEESFQSPSREWTGRWIGVGIIPREYFYQITLASPVAFLAGEKYWLEVVQIGDISTKFRWESSVSENDGHAFINPGVIDWRSTLPGGSADLAFQLITPEPTYLTLLALGVFVCARRR